MSCEDCRYQYTLARMQLLDNQVRRMANVMTYGQHSTEVLDAKNTIVRDYDAFDRQWAVPRPCPHVAGAVAAPVEPLTPLVKLAPEEARSMGVNTLARGSEYGSTTGSTKASSTGKGTKGAGSSGGRRGK